MQECSLHGKEAENEICESLSKNGRRPVVYKDHLPGSILAHKEEMQTKVHVTGTPKKDFENEKYIIILYLFCAILYTESQILYTIPSCAFGNSNLGGWGHAAPPPNAVST